VGAASLISAAVERRARWVLDTLGARDASLGDELPYDAEAWEAVDRGERPAGDELADAFFHLARLEERDTARGARDAHGRFRAAASCLDPLDPPLERLRARLGLEPPRWFGARFAVALTHDIDVPWRWTRRGALGAAARAKAAIRARRPSRAAAEAAALATLPLHKARGTDPNWTFERIADIEAAHGARSTHFVLAGHAHPADGPAPDAYERLRPRLVAALLESGAEIGLHGSYTAADDAARLAAERDRLAALAGPLTGQRYHYLRVDPHRNLVPLVRLGFAYDGSFGFADAPGFRGGIAQPFRPWDLARGRPLDLVELPLALMDATLGEERYLGLSARDAEGEVMRLLDWAAERGGGFAILWHNEWFDERAFPGWAALYERTLAGVEERGGVCVSAGDLAEEAAAWLR
jgi:peptidoglycan/xylan/chitin deacetylase (PgdA/CDA1 family)